MSNLPHSNLPDSEMRAHAADETKQTPSTISPPIQMTWFAYALNTLSAMAFGALLQRLLG